MADSPYAAWSLHDLKAAAAAAKPSGLERDVTSFADGESAMLAVREQFDAALAALSDSWTGTAAQAAATNARAAIATLTDTSQTAAATSGAVVGYAQSVRDSQRAVAAIPDKSFDWGEALTVGSFAGPIGIGGDALKQAVEAEQHRKHAAELVEQMDHAGHAHADVMKAMPWVQSKGMRDVPVALTPPPDTATSRAEAGQPRPESRESPDATLTSQPRTSDGEQSDGRVRADGHRNGVETATPRSEHPRAAIEATSVAGGVGLPVAQNLAEAAASNPATAASVAVPSTAATAALGGAGVTAGGLVAGATGRGGIAAGEAGVTSGGRLSGGTSPGDRPSSGRGGTAERTGGRVNADPRASTPRTPLADLAIRERAAPPTGGYPLGGAAGQRRDDEDELRARPEYLVETDEIWGDGRTAAPPVLG